MDKKPEDKKPMDKKPEDKKPEDKGPEDKKPEEKKPEDKKPEDKKPEDKKPEDKKPMDKKEEEKDKEPKGGKSADDKKKDEEPEDKGPKGKDGEKGNDGDKKPEPKEEEKKDKEEKPDKKPMDKKPMDKKPMDKKPACHMVVTSVEGKLAVKQEDGEVVKIKEVACCTRPRRPNGPGKKGQRGKDKGAQDEEDEGEVVMEMKPIKDQTFMDWVDVKDECKDQYPGFYLCSINDLTSEEFMDITPDATRLHKAWLADECEVVDGDEASKISDDLEEKNGGPKVSGDLGAGKGGKPGKTGKPGYGRSSSGTGGQAPARMEGHHGTESDVFHRGDDLNPMVIGAAVAGLLMVIVAVVLFVMRRRRRRSAKGQEAEMGKVVHVPDDSTNVVVDEVVDEGGGDRQR